MNKIERGMSRKKWEDMEVIIGYYHLFIFNGGRCKE